MMRNKITSAVWSFLRLFILVGLSFVLLYPLLFMLSTAFRPLDQIADPSIIWIPKSITFDNFVLAFKAMHYLDSFYNTIIIGGVSSVIQVVFCSVIGYGFARFKFKERPLMFAMVIFTIIVPPQTIVVPLYLMYKNFFPFIGPILSIFFGIDVGVNLLNNNGLFYISAMLGVGIRSGLYIFVFRQFFRGIPNELEEAAIVDGCGAFQTFLKIMVPNALGAFLTVFLFSFVWYWNDFFNTSMFLTGRMTLAVSLSSLKQNLQTLGIDIYDPYMISTRLQAGSLLTIGPLLIMYIGLQKYFTESIERTGIVG